MEQTQPSPPTPHRHAEGKVLVVAAADALPAEGLRDLLTLPDVLRGLPGESSRAAGRTTVWRWEPAWRPEGALIVRQFVHGGALGRLWRTLFLSSRPMLNELSVALHAQTHQVPTARPVAVRIERVFGPFLRAHYVTEEVPDARNLLEFCREAGELPPARRQRLARLIAGAIARMHQAGIDHGDLNLKNLLVAAREGAHEAYVIDFKKAQLQNHVGLERGLTGLVRLDRSVVKWKASRRAVSLCDRLRTLREYVRLQAGAAEGWKDVARRIRTRHRSHALSRE